jgi:hypothetical protein
LLVLLTAWSALADAPAPALSSLEGLVQTLIELRSAKSSASNKWREQQSALQNEKRLLQSQRKTLQNELDRRKSELSARQNELQSIQQNQASLNQTLTNQGRLVAESETRLQTLLPQLPPPLVTQLEPMLSGLSETPLTPQNFGSRLKNTLEVLALIEQFDRDLHHSRLILADPSGEKREMDVLFVGLSLAYAVPPQQNLGGIGRPGPAGWTWQWQADASPAIRRALAIYRKERPAEFVQLPVPGKAQP